MSRLTTLVALPAALALVLSATTADAGWSKNISIDVQKGINLANTISRRHGINPPPVIRPIQPPIVIRPPQPPIVRPPVRPPVLRPICPPKPPVIIHPPVRPIQPPVCHPVLPVETPAPTTAFRPIGFPSAPQPAVVPSRTWYFGMSLELTQTVYGRGLRIASITHGAPAAMAGLEIGDVLIVANGQGLQAATSNENGVQMIQSLVTPQGVAQFGVLDVRTQQPTYLNVMPRRLGGAPAPTAAGPGFPQFPAPPAPVASLAAPAQAF